jgi:hypothetical protein
MDFRESGSTKYAIWPWKCMHHGDMGKNKKRTEVTQQQKIAL